MPVSIRKDDEVLVMSGKDRGKRGRVVNVLPREGRIMVEGIARAKKHARPSRQRQQGGIVDIEQFVDISNVMLLCKSCGQPTRVGHRFDDDGAKVRVCKRCEADL
ncbi:MAG TPA: 50S ribosomal protein L24 [Actinomycetota bacterium]|nr:50S ribosomal protein L24 [Actinomycetota bacterium]